MRTKLTLCLLLLAALHSPRAGQAQASGPFTYQGRLDDGGSAANGVYDLSFAVYDDLTAGTLLAEPVTNSAVLVSNGLFTVTLDFGPNVFTGSARWLELAVSPGGADDFLTLAPRQAVTATPYALLSETALNVADGSVVKSLNTLTDHVTLQAGANVTITPSGNSLTIASAGAGGSGIWSLNGSSTYYNGGNVGIGTLSPASRLAVQTGSGLYGFTHTDGAITLGSYIGSSTSGANGGWLGTLSNHPLHFFINNGQPSMTVDTTGRIGIGTTTPATRLTVRTGTFNPYGIEHTDGTVRLTTYVDGFAGWLGTRSNHPLSFFVNDGLPSLTIDTGGATTLSPIGGYGTVTFGTPNGEGGMTIKGGNRADVRFNGSSLKLVAGSGVGPPSSFSGIAVTTGGNVGMGTDAPLAKLDVRGTTRTCVLTITGGCDLAEPFAMKEGEMEKGSVVVIDDEHAGRLKGSTRAYDTRVAGIVSGANGINPGISLQQEGVLEGGQNVALSGRVYVKADAAHGAIKPGDLLTTSDTPGHAMRVGNHALAQGAILGKAMSGLAEGRGMVLVLVSLQ